MGTNGQAALPDPKAWAQEALTLFQRTSLPNKAWPGFRDEYICRQISALADERQKLLVGSWGSG